MTRPKPRARIPEREIDLNQQAAAMALIDQRRRDTRVSLEAMEHVSGVSIGAYNAWRANRRSPLWSKFVALADAFGFDVVMRGPGGEFATGRSVDLMAAIEVAAKAQRLSLVELEVASGFSMNSLYSWRRGGRDPGMFGLVAVAESCGFKLVMCPRMSTA